MVRCKSAAKEVSFEWSHHRIYLKDSEVKTVLHVSMIDAKSERVLKIEPCQNRREGIRVRR